MKTYLNIILFLAGIQLINAQVQDGTLDINGSPNFAQSITTMEAGLDDVELINIKNIEKQIYEEIKSSSPDIIDSINNTGKLEEEIEKKLTSIIEQFKKKNK